MERKFSKIRRILLGKIFLNLWLWRNNDYLLIAMRKVNKIQLSVKEIKTITTLIRHKPNCNLLVFGVGNDSILWQALNPFGRNVFIEDNNYWLDKIKARVPGLKAYTVTYGTTLTNWRKDIASIPQLELPDDVQNFQWDIILVDAPAGNKNDDPGRLQSINTAANIASAGSFVLVHDCNRELEQQCSSTYLGEEYEAVDRLRVYAI